MELLEYCEIARSRKEMMSFLELKYRTKNIINLLLSQGLTILEWQIYNKYYIAKLLQNQQLFDSNVLTKAHFDNTKKDKYQK